MRVFPILAAVLFLAGAAAASGGEPAGRTSDFDEYLRRLRAVVEGYSQREAELCAWCRAVKLDAEADAALGRARACDPASAEPPPAKNVPPAPDPRSAFASKIFSLRAATGRDWAALALFCRDKALLFECRRCVEKALAWDPRNEEAKRLASNPSVKAGAGRRSAPEGVWLGERWVRLEDYEKSARARIRLLLEERGKATGLPFQGDFLPGIDILYTTSAGECADAKASLEKYLAFVQGRFFLSRPAKPLQFFLLRDPEELRKTGGNPMLMGAYEWGKGRLTVTLNPMGLGTVLHEMTHALMEANFRTFPPLWINEGIACFFETYEDLGAAEPFGWLNWRDDLYAQAVREGKARTLEALLRECSFTMIDLLGYAQGRTLMNYLWSLGELEAFVVSSQLAGRDADFGAILSSHLHKPLAEATRDLEAFAGTIGSRPVRVERGVRADEAIDAPMGEGPSPEGGK